MGVIDIGSKEVDNKGAATTVVVAFSRVAIVDSVIRDL